MGAKRLMLYSSCIYLLITTTDAVPLKLSTFEHRSRSLPNRLEPDARPELKDLSDHQRNSDLRATRRAIFNLRFHRLSLISMKPAGSNTKISSSMHGEWNAPILSPGETWTVEGNAGMVVPQEMRDLLTRPGFLSGDEALRFRDLYSNRQF
ncbi:hypothetical protein BKA70DRAFT_704828 [Coprinopsis sp. MPI-PUGE-AT-0042]|nr:hypothetical protein BKA70DRAFT_704828 [Coprinopsis sp. MPI-PUGE-AT-0042]